MTSVSDSIDVSVTPRLIAVDDVRAAAADMHFSQTRAVLDGTAASHDDYNGDRATFMTALHRLDRLAATAADRHALAAIHAAVSRANTVDGRMFGLLAAGNSVSAAAVMNADADPANDRIVPALTSYQAHLREQESRLTARAASTSSEAQWAIVIFTLAAAAAAAALATVLTRRIGRRIRRMLVAAEGIAVGELDHDVATESTDELGRRPPGRSSA